MNVTRENTAQMLVTLLVCRDSGFPDTPTLNYLCIVQESHSPSTLCRQPRRSWPVSTVCLCTCTYTTLTSWLPLEPWVSQWLSDFWPTVHSGVDVFAYRRLISTPATNTSTSLWQSLDWWTYGSSNHWWVSISQSIMRLDPSLCVLACRRTWQLESVGSRLEVLGSGNNRTNLFSFLRLPFLNFTIWYKF